MKEISNLTDEQIGEKIIQIYNENPWVMRPHNPDHLNEGMQKIYLLYRDLNESLAERYNKNKINQYLQGSTPNISYTSSPNNI